MNVGHHYPFVGIFPWPYKNVTTIGLDEELYLSFSPYFEIHLLARHLLYLLSAIASRFLSQSPLNKEQNFYLLDNTTKRIEDAWLQRALSRL
jgi:hypothetical protein